MKKIAFLVFLLVFSMLLTSCSGAVDDNGLGESEQISGVANDSTDASSDDSKGDDEMYIPPRKIRIACVGDSITYGVGASNQAISSYPSQLKRMLGKNYDIQNFGRSSSYMINPVDYPDYKYAASRSVAYTSTNEYQTSLKYTSDMVFICLGANDAYISNTNSGVEQERYFYESAVKLAKTYQALESKPTVFFVYPPARYDAQYRIDYIKSTIIPMIDKAAKECGCEVIDLFSKTEQYAKNKDTKYITTDGIHLADDGYTVMAEAIYEKAAAYRIAE